jgi:capsular polysaccharide biosynthesis protein
LTGGYHLAFWIGAALIGAAIGVALVVLRDRGDKEVKAAETVETVEPVSVA